MWKQRKGEGVPLRTGSYWPQGSGYILALKIRVVRRWRRVVEINIDPVGAAWHGGGVLLFGFGLIVLREASNFKNLISVTVSMSRYAIKSNKRNLKNILYFHLLNYNSH